MLYTVPTSVCNIMLAVCFPLALLLIAAAAEESSSAGAAPRVPLADGRDMPQLGLGTWLGLSKTGGRVPVSDEAVQAAVEWALDAGYRHIDTAAIYNTEPQVGRAVNKKIVEGVVKRSDLFITTKLWNDAHARAAVVPALRASLARLNLSYVDLYLIHWPVGLQLWNDAHARAAVVPALRASLARLNLSYVDLYLIHWPVGLQANGSYDDTDYLETWRGMVEAQTLGLTRSIGLSNFNQHMIDRVIANSSVRPAVLQVELNLNLQQPELLKYCRDQNIVVTGYTPFGSLFRSKAAEGAPAPRDDDPALVAIADRHNRTVTQIALRYLVELGVVPIPKSVTRARISQNLDVFGFQLSGEERDQLRAYDAGYRTIAVTHWADHPYYPFEKN